MDKPSQKPQYNSFQAQRPKAAPAAFTPSPEAKPSLSQVMSPKPAGDVSKWFTTVCAILFCALVVATYLAFTTVQAQSQLAASSQLLAQSQNDQMMLNTQVMQLNGLVDESSVGNAALRSQLSASQASFSGQAMLNTQELEAIKSALNVTVGNNSALGQVASNYNYIQTSGCWYYFSGTYNVSGITIPLFCTLAVDNLLIADAALVNQTNQTAIGPSAAMDLVNGYLANSTG